MYKNIAQKLQNLKRLSELETVTFRCIPNGILHELLVADGYFETSPYDPEWFNMFNEQDEK